MTLDGSWVLSQTPFRCSVLGVSLEDRQIGEHIRQLRVEKGMSQTALAQAMTDFGYPMQQQTILKIEKGSRALKLAEAIAMAGALNQTVTAMVPLDNERHQIKTAVSMATGLRQSALDGTELLVMAERGLGW